MMVAIEATKKAHEICRAR